MDVDRSTKLTSSLPIVGVLLVIAGAYYISQSQLKSSRPKAPVGLEHPATEKEKIDARMWQDPFKAVYDYRQAKRNAEKKDPCDPPVYHLSEQIDRFIRSKIPTETKDPCEPDFSLLTRQINFFAKKDDVNIPNTSFEKLLNDVKTRVDEVKTKVDIVTEQIKQSMFHQRSLHIMLIMVRDGNSAEDYERRLRNRYAVLTALRAQGMSSEDTQHICYFTDVYNPKEKSAHHVSGTNKIFRESAEHLVFPYEWFVREELYPITIQEWVDDRPEQVLLIWLPESVFSSKPLAKLAKLIDAIGRRRSNRGEDIFYDWSHDMGKNQFIKVDLIGPSYSGTLREMLNEIEVLNRSSGTSEDTNSVDIKSRLNHLGIFSPWATVSPALLVDTSFIEDPNTPNSPFQMQKVILKKFEKIGVEFFQMIGSDDLLTIHLLRELNKRGIRPVGGKDHVALISEWDTFYGKAFPLAFATMMESIDPNDPNLIPDWKKYAKNLNRKMPDDRRHSFPGNLHTYTYISGIDGILTEPSSSQDKQSSENAQNGKGESLSNWIYTESLKRPIDRSQLDYVRRLARKLSNDYTRSSKLKAIGVVGSDVYDKLILLHALREQFSDVIFFTTDMDARLMHDEQYKWTRNVIVASNFGLELSGKYQRNIYQYQEESSFSTFRDNYQTSLFFACRVALGLRVDPYKFEQENLGIESYQQLSGREHSLSESMLRNHPGTLIEYTSHPRLFEIGRNRAVDISADETAIHPPRHMFTWEVRELSVLILLLTVFCSLLLAQINAHARGLLLLISPTKWGLPGIGVKLAVTVMALFIAIGIHDHYRDGGERFLLSAGVSIWPGEILRLTALILSLLFLSKSYNDLKKHDQKLEHDFHLNNDPPENGNTPKSGNAREIWEKYINRNTFGKRALRITGISSVYILFVLTLMFILGCHPNVPYRGSLSWKVDFVLLVLSTVSLIILIYFVVDATKSSLCLVRDLKPPLTAWPEELLNEYKTANITQPVTNSGQGTDTPEYFPENFSEKALAEWLDIKFIASHTKVVGNLIYYPFIILLIMFLARSRYFDNWNFPISLIIIYLLNSTCALCCGWMLRREAENTRNIALNRLQEELIKATGAGNECSSKQIRAMIEEVESMRQGAYSPLTENPVLHAILIPSGGISLFTLLRFVPIF